MPVPYAPSIVLDDAVREQLEALLRARSTPQALAFRVRIVLRAADDEAPPNLQIAAEFGCSKDTVSLWRRRFAADGLAGLQDAPRSGRPRSFFPPRNAWTWFRSQRVSLWTTIATPRGGVWTTSPGRSSMRTTPKP